MTQILQTSDGDIAITNNKFSLTTHMSDEEIIQSLKQALKLFYGEWFLDLTIGLPYMQAIFVKGTPVEITESFFKETIIESKGIRSLNRFDSIEYDPATRKASIAFDVTTINGNNLTINEELP